MTNVNDDPTKNHVVESLETDGYVIRLPHQPTLETPVPLDMSEFTDYERQEIHRYWRDAVRDAYTMISCGTAHLNALLRSAETRGGYYPEMASGGDSQPVYVAARLLQNRMRLQGVIQGARHRIAMDRLRDIGGDPERTLEVG